jgi:hypothetical protein
MDKIRLKKLAGLITESNKKSLFEAPLLDKMFANVIRQVMTDEEILMTTVDVTIEKLESKIDELKNPGNLEKIKIAKDAIRKVEMDVNMKIKSKSLKTPQSVVKYIDDTFRQELVNIFQSK